MIDKIIPLGQRVLIKPFPAETVSKGGIIFPESCKEKSDYAIVVETGLGDFATDGTRIDFFVKTGDRVLYNKGAGTKTTVSGEECLIVSEGDILAKVN